jgi:hypothetical protein
MNAKPPLPARTRSHRKRLSISRLSSDSTPALPAYLGTEDLPDDRPPDYPESAHEADADTDTSTPDTFLPLSSPRPRRGFSHRRRRSASPITSSSGDPYLDSLLARSVHALEMSNALLQSSISTHTSLSAVLAVDSPVVDSSLEARAHDLTSRIRVNSRVHANWMDDLAAISEHITTDSRPDALGLSLDHEDAMSRSLPTDPSPLRQLRAPHHRNHSSSDLRHIKADTVNSVEPHLCLSTWSRSRLVSPAPRALTQYVESNADPETIFLPSTLGLRSSSSTHFPSGVSSPPPPPSLAPASAPSSLLHSASHEPSTTAYTLLSSFLARRSSTSSAGSHVSSRSHSERLKATAETATTSSRTSSTVVPSRSRTPHSSPSRSRVGKCSLSLPPVHPPLVLPTRPLTPPTENPSLSSLSSTSSSNTSSDPHPNPVLSLQALRKILDDQPRPPAPPEGRAPRRPVFLPRTPLPAPTLGTSTATASVSRLFTKPVHLHSGSSSREPRQSALKGGLRTPQSPASFNGGMLSPGQSTGPGGSSASSARSTPKRISFAELPEPYGSERGGGSGRGFEKKRSKRAKKRNGKGKGQSKSDAGAGSDGSDDEDDDRGWWAKLLLGTGGSARSLSLGRPEERVESRIARGLGSRGGFGGGIEDWAV